jgi:glycosyltransferase involved in cell wall biosynthesis
MKIIGLMPVKNEEWILNATIPQLKKFVDEILILDVESTDRTKQILKQHGVFVLDQKYHPVNLSMWRQRLLNWGRERGGTHFVWLDADEAFSSNFTLSFKSYLKKLSPGQKLSMYWAPVWGSPNTIRSDNSVWCNLYKDFVFCDDETSNFDNVALHEGRTPGVNSPENTITVPKANGSVLHFQFVSQERFHMKQAFQRCRELQYQNTTPFEINKKYSITIDKQKPITKKIPCTWIKGIQNLDSLIDLDSDWYLQAIEELFREYGILFFESLQIWQIPELYNRFILEIKRKPQPVLKPEFRIRLRQKITSLIPIQVKKFLKKVIKNEFSY